MADYVLGTDITTTNSGDLARTARDLGTLSGVENVVAAFVRELMTPYGYLARFVLDSDGLKVVDEVYGNAAYYQLSEPMTGTWVAEMVELITAVAAAQERITLLGVDYEILSLEKRGIRFLVRFQIDTDSTEFNLVLKPEDRGFAAELSEV